MKMEDKQAMLLSPRRLEHRDSSKRDISFWHLCAIYGLLTLCVVMGMLSLVSLHHLNRRQMDVEMRLGMSSSSSSSSGSGCIYFDTHQSVIAREPAPERESQIEYVYEGQEGLPESGYGTLSGVGWDESPRSTEPSNLAWSLENSKDSRVRNSDEVPSEHQTPEEELTSVPNGLSSTSESSTTKLIRGVPRTRLSRDTRGREGNTERVTSVRPQGGKKNQKTPSNSIPLFSASLVLFTFCFLLSQNCYCFLAKNTTRIIKVSYMI